MHLPLLPELDIRLRHRVVIAAEYDACATAAVPGQCLAKLGDEIRSDAVDLHPQQSRETAAGIGQCVGAAGANLEAAAGEIVDAQAAFHHQ